MAAPIPTNEPQFIIAGDSLFFDKQIPNFSPVDGWTLSYALKSFGLADITISGGVITSSGATWSVRVPAATTKAWAGGTYKWKSFVTGSGANAGQRFTIESGEFEIKPDPASVPSDGSFDPRSANQKMLDAIESLIAGRATADVHMYKIGSREIQKMPILELLKWRSVYKNEVRQERIAAGEEFASNTVGAFFGPVR